MNCLERITIYPVIWQGKHCIKGMCWPVEVILDMLGAEMTNAQILKGYQELQKEDIHYSHSAICKTAFIR